MGAGGATLYTLHIPRTLYTVYILYALYTLYISLTHGKGKAQRPQREKGKWRSPLLRSNSTRQPDRAYAHTHERNEPKRFPNWTHPPTSDLGKISWTTLLGDSWKTILCNSLDELSWEISLYHSLGKSSLGILFGNPLGNLSWKSLLEISLGKLSLELFLNSYLGNLSS